MKSLIQFKQVRKLLLIPLMLACFGLLPQAQAQTNTAYGNGALVSLTSGIWNSGFGFEALNHDTAGNQNTATGLRALFSDTNGGFNTATGVYSLFSNTSGFFNSAVGAYSLANNISGSFNTANGYGALYRNTADYNTANGFGALYKNTSGSYNTATGYEALFSNTTANNNTANGFGALDLNTTGDANTAIGSAALQSNIGGNNNTAIGASALPNNTGGGNTAVGWAALPSNTAGLSNTALGAAAGGSVTMASNVICIGANVIGEDVSNSCYIGSIFGQTSSGGTAVYINSSGRLGTATSSRRFKDDIKPRERASEALFALKPVTFRYKKGIDPQGIPQFGLVAEDVEEVNPDLVVRDKEGKVNTVRYEAVNVMLLNEFLKEHRKVEEQQVRITELNSRAAKQEALAAEQEKSFQSKLAEQDKQIEALTSGLEKVSAQLEVTKSAPQVVSSNP
jgi:hypothetical protein